MHDAVSLKGQRILLLRSRPHDHDLEQALRNLGANTDSLPLLQIEALDHLPPIESDRYQGLIFTSRNAARLAPAWPEAVPIFAVGPATAAALRHRGVENITTPTDTRSEGLLALPALQDIKDQRWLIIKGEGGRDLLPHILRDRGADVDSLDVYQRSPIKLDLDQLSAEISAAAIWFIFSGDILMALRDQCPDNLNNQLLDQQLVVPSQRVVKMAQDLGFRKPAIAVENMSKAGIISTLLRHFGSQSTHNAGA